MATIEALFGRKGKTSSEQRRKANLWLRGPTLLLLPLAIYVGGYFVLGNYTSSSTAGVRLYRSSTIAFAYSPLGWLESRIRRRTVCLAMPGRSELGGRMICLEP